MTGLTPKNKGETLMETLIAISVIAIGIAVASTVILNSIRYMQNAKNRVIALNIAREGLEGMRNIRDTNWLFYSDRRRQCWNHDPSTVPCEGDTPIIPGTYVIYRDIDHRWQLALADSDVDVDSDGDNIPDNDLDLAPLALVDIDENVDSDGDENPTNDRDTYNHVDEALNSLGEATQETSFKRYLQIEYLDDDGAFSAISQTDEPFDSINSLKEWSDGGLDSSALNRMRITSVVEWTIRGTTHRTQLKTILTDHLDRENFDN